MNWITSLLTPGIRNLLKRETPENLWIKCPETGQMVFRKDVENNLNVIPGSDYHMRWSAAERMVHMFGDASFEEIAIRDVQADPLKFRDEKRYADRLRDARTKTGLGDSVKVAIGPIDGVMTTIAVQDFDFIGGTLGMAAGEGIIAGLETAASKKTPFVLFVASGGARLQEGILSLMQMPRTTIAVRRLRALGLPYIVVMTNPTTGGVAASYAMLGDVHIAEPGALIGFAGPRVIEATVREKLPEGFQRSEYLKEHGMVDMVVHRRDLRATIVRLIRILTKAGQTAAIPALPAKAA
jgi:acetyl-CoA carboxylase carboxyl transferase subunit beta